MEFVYCLDILKKPEMICLSKFHVTTFNQDVKDIVSFTNLYERAERRYPLIYTLMEYIFL